MLGIWPLGQKPPISSEVVGVLPVAHMTFLPDFRRRRQKANVSAKEQVPLQLSGR
jgi:hypothetical protein